MAILCYSHYSSNPTALPSKKKTCDIMQQLMSGGSFSKDWQIACPVRISTFTMGWFSPLPRVAPHGTQTMPYGYGSKPTVPKWYPHGTQTSFVVAGWLWKMLFPQSYGKSIGNLTHPHIHLLRLEPLLLYPLYRSSWMPLTWPPTNSKQATFKLSKHIM